MKFAFMLLAIASLVITSFAAPRAPANVAALVSDANNINVKVLDLDKAVIACPSSGAGTKDLLVRICANGFHLFMLT